jgi:hypothetical protein
MVASKSPPPSSSSSEKNGAAREGAPSPSGSRASVDPQKARQGEIILRRPMQRWIFFGGLIAATILGVVIFALAGS